MRCKMRKYHSSRFRAICGVASHSRLGSSDRAWRLERTRSQVGEGAFSGQLQADVSDTDMDSRANISLARHSPLHRSPLHGSEHSYPLQERRRGIGSHTDMDSLDDCQIESRPHLFTAIDCTVAKADVNFKRKRTR